MSGLTPAQRERAERNRIAALERRSTLPILHLERSLRQWDFWAACDLR
jgi:hypothetical protein